MRVLVTGSHGFIGSNLVRALKERGDEVVECDIKIEMGLDKLLDLPYEFYDEIYHLACINQEVSAIMPMENLAVNAYGTRMMAHLAKNMGARFVYTSTASVYGDRRRQPIESFRLPDPKSDYAVAKLTGELFVKNSGADFTIFRLSNVYGPGQSTENPYCGVVAKFLEAARAGKPLQIIGDGSQTRDFTYVEDILPHLMNPELKGTLNCSSERETSVLQLYREIQNLLPMWEDDPADQRPGLFLKYVPERPVDGIQRRCLVSDVECPTGLPEGLQKTLDWLKSEDQAEKAGKLLQSSLGKL